MEGVWKDRKQVTRSTKTFRTRGAQLPRTALPSQPGQRQSRIWVSSRVTRPKSQIRLKIYRRSDLAETTRKQPESVAHKAEIQPQDGPTVSSIEDRIGLREDAPRRRRRKAPDRREERGLRSRRGVGSESEDRTDTGGAVEVRPPRGADSWDSYPGHKTTGQSGDRTVEDRPPPEEDRQPAAVFGGGQWKTRSLLMKTDRATKTPPTRTTSVGQVGHRRRAMSAASPS